jgi:signal transduction histidine kinase
MEGFINPCLSLRKVFATAPKQTETLPKCPHSDQIFNPFFTTNPLGTGMGIRISRSIIESHGGRLWAAGASGRGATFQFILPAATVAAHM